MTQDTSIVTVDSTDNHDPDLSPWTNNDSLAQTFPTFIVSLFIIFCLIIVAIFAIPTLFADAIVAQSGHIRTWSSGVFFAPDASVQTRSRVRDFPALAESVATKIDTGNLTLLVTISNRTDLSRNLTAVPINTHLWTFAGKTIPAYQAFFQQETDQPTTNLNNDWRELAADEQISIPPKQTAKLVLTFNYPADSIDQVYAVNYNIADKHINAIGVVYDIPAEKLENFL